MRIEKWPSANQTVHPSFDDVAPNAAHLRMRADLDSDDAHWLDVLQISGIFAEGTWIDTPTGQTKIEDLQIGDEVRSFKNGKIGVQRCTALPDHSVPDQVLCIRAGYMNAQHDLIAMPYQLARLDHWLGAALFESKFPFVVASRVCQDQKVELVPKGQTQFYRLDLGIHDAITANGVMCMVGTMDATDGPKPQSRLKTFEHRELTTEETRQALEAGSFFRKARALV